MSITLRKSMPVLGALGVLGPMGNDIFLPAMPLMAIWFAAPPASIQVALGAMSIGMAVGQLTVGIIADRVGRRIPMIAGATLATVAAVAAALSPAVWVLVIACFFMGLGASSGMVVGRAVVSDIADGVQARKAYAILGSLTGVGPVAGPLLGTLLLTIWGWQATFTALALMAAAVTVAVIIVIPETLPEQGRLTHRWHQYPALLWSILKTPSFFVNAMFIWLGFALVFGYISASSYIVQDILHWSPGAYSLVFAINGLSMAVVGFLTGMLVHKFSTRVLLGCSVFIMLIATVLLVFAVMTNTITAWTLLPAMWLIAISLGFVFGPATGNGLSQMRDRSGTALALMGAIQFIAGGIAAPLVGIAGNTSIVPLTVLAVICSLGVLATFIFGRAFTR